MAIESCPHRSEALVAACQRAPSAFRLRRDPLLLALASGLAGSDVVFESTIRGNSMLPAIPGRARLRVRLLGGQPCERGDVVFYLSDEGFVIHRVVHLPRARRAAAWVLTLGDNCIVPDPPVSMKRILGKVIAVETAGRWHAPGPAVPHSPRRRLARAATSGAVVAALVLGVPAAQRMAIALRRLGFAGGAKVGRILRRLRPFASDR